MKNISFIKLSIILNVEFTSNIVYFHLFVLKKYWVEDVQGLEYNWKFYQADIFKVYVI